MDRRLRSAIGCVVVMANFAGLVAGCAYPQSRGEPAATRTVTGSATPGVPPEIRSSNSVEALLRYGTVLRSIPAEALEREYVQAADALTRSASAPNRIRMALLLSVPGASFQDTGRAKGYLEEVAGDTDGSASQYRDLARFLMGTLHDRYVLEGALADERRQRQELKQKLDQLKVIEQDTGARIPHKPMKEH